MTTMSDFPENLELRDSPIHGWGVFTFTPIKKNQVIGNYDGIKYTLREFKEKYGKDYQYCYYARRANYIISAKKSRNFATWMNESLNPNCKIKCGKVIALRNIQPDEELTLQYPKAYPRDYVLT